MEDCNFN